MTKPPDDKPIDLVFEDTEPLAEDAASAIIKALQAAGVVPEGFTPQVVVHKPQPAPEPEPPRGPVAEMASWAVWRQAMAEVAPTRYGWSPGRLGVRMGDGVFFPYGALRANYGVFLASFNICKYDHSEESVEQTSGLLASVVHLPTGVGLAIFDNADTACAAVDIIANSDPMRGAPQISDAPDVLAQWHGLSGRVCEIWRFNGFTHVPDAHCHPPGDKDAPIWTRNFEALIAGRPEKAS